MQQRIQCAFFEAPSISQREIPSAIKKVPDRKLVSIKDELCSRCHLDSWSDPCSLRSAFTLPATDVCLHVTEYSAILRYTFDCALGGPFDSLHFHPDHTIPDSLWAHHCLYLRFIGLFIVYFLQKYHVFMCMSTKTQYFILILSDSPLLPPCDWSLYQITLSRSHHQAVLSDFSIFPILPPDTSPC